MEQRRRPVSSRLFGRDPDVPDDFEGQLALLSSLHERHPDFLRLFYICRWSEANDPAVAWRWCARGPRHGRSGGSATRSRAGAAEAPLPEGPNGSWMISHRAGRRDLHGVCSPSNLEPDTDGERMYQSVLSGP